MQGLHVIERDLVTVYETDTGEKVVYGSELHAVLEVKSRFNDWVHNRLDDCEAAEGRDYETLTKNLVNGGQTKEYIIRLDVAKEMAMLERNEKGKQVRRYFIHIEQKYHTGLIQTEKLSPELQMFGQIFKTMARQEMEQKRQAERLEQVENDMHGIREVLEINTESWRETTNRTLRRIAAENKDRITYQDIRTESYDILERKMGVSLRRRLSNKRQRMTDEGISRSRRDKVNYLDVIEEDKKLIVGYVETVKEMALRYGTA